METYIVNKTCFRGVLLFKTHFAEFCVKYVCKTMPWNWAVRARIFKYLESDNLSDVKVILVMYIAPADIIAL